MVLGQQRHRCSWGVWVVYAWRPWSFREVYMERSCAVRDEFEGRPRIARELSVGHLWGIREAPMGVAWSTLGVHRLLAG